MKLFFPDNLFAHLIVTALPDDLKTKSEFAPSSLISKEIKYSDDAAGFIPSMDIITNKDLFVSKNFGLSFEETLCLSYLYFKPGQQDVSKIYLHGDVSSNEVILTKILFKEHYDTGVDAHILTELKEDANNFLISGDKNFEEERFLTGLSFAEKFIETISLPYVHYVLASTNDQLLNEINEKLKETGEKIYNYVDDLLESKNYSDVTKQQIKQGISSFIFKLAQQDIDGLDQLLRLPYFHGIIDDIVEVKFV